MRQHASWSVATRTHFSNKISRALRGACWSVCGGGAGTRRRAERVEQERSDSQHTSQHVSLFKPVISFSDFTCIMCMMCMMIPILLYAILFYTQFSFYHTLPYTFLIIIIFFHKSLIFYHFKIFIFIIIIQFIMIIKKFQNLQI
jgi:hypothetical protein